MGVSRVERVVYGIIIKKNHLNITVTNRFLMSLWEGEKIKNFK